VLICAQSASQRLRAKYLSILKEKKEKIPLKGPTKSAILENFINVINAAIL
jgi:hypothetical protein